MSHLSPKKHDYHTYPTQQPDTYHSYIPTNIKTSTPSINIQTYLHQIPQTTKQTYKHKSNQKTRRLYPNFTELPISPKQADDLQTFYFLFILLISIQLVEKVRPTDSVALRRPYLNPT